MKVDRRSVAPVISVILMVAIVVILGAVISVFALGFTENVNQPAPNVADTTGEFNVTKSDRYTLDNQLVRITHLSGDSIAVEELEIIVRASGPGVNTEARLVDLPADGESVDAENIRGNDELISENGGGLSKNYRKTQS